MQDSGQNLTLAQKNEMLSEQLRLSYHELEKWENIETKPKFEESIGETIFQQSKED